MNGTDRVGQTSQIVRNYKRSDSGMSGGSYGHVRYILDSYRRLSNHRVALLAGGVGGARMARALRSVVDPGHLTVIVNVGDDTERYGVHVAADPDTVMYTLAGINGEQGWGRSSDTTTVMESLTELGFDTSFTLGDKDLALCMARTLMLERGDSLSEATASLASHLGVSDVTLLPATNDRLRTWIEIDDGEWLSFQEYFVDRRHADPVSSIAYHGAVEARPAPNVIDAIETADTLVIAPSNPPLSIWPILAVDGISSAVRAHPNRVAVSPLFGGVPTKGPADVVMAGVGLSAGTEGILEAYDGMIDTLWIDDADHSDIGLGTMFDVSIATANTVLTGVDNGAEFAHELLMVSIRG